MSGFWPVSPGTSPRSPASPLSPLSVQSNGSRKEDRFQVSKDAESGKDSPEVQVRETPQVWSTVKIWQLVLFISCLVVLVLSTLLVILESVMGLVSGRGPGSAEQSWTMPDAFDCQVDRWEQSKEWSDLRLDFCCQEAGIGCSRTPGYRCHTESDPRSLPFSMLRWCCATEQEFCEHVQTSLDTLVAAKVNPSKPCTGHGCGRDRRYDCKRDSSLWHLAWSVQKIEWCCQHKELDCSALPTPTAQRELHRKASTTRAYVPVHAARKVESEPEESEEPYGCQEKCLNDGSFTLCTALVGEMAQGLFAKETTPCRAAKNFVMAKCPQCSDCINDQSTGCSFAYK